MYVNDKKQLYDDFCDWVKEGWDYFVPNSLFSNSLERRKAKGFSSYAIKDISDEVLSDKRQLLKEYIAFSLNGNSSSGYKKWIVNYKTISNVFIEHDDKNITFFFDWNEYEQSEFNVEELYDELTRIFLSTSEFEMKKYGFSASLINEWKEIVNSIASEGQDIENKYRFKFVFISKNDYASKIKIDGKEWEVWGLPSIFKNIEYQEFKEYKDEIEFRVEHEISKSTHTFISIKGNKDTTGRSDEVLVTPIRVSDLFKFIRRVKEERGSIDTLFTLNVRDRKNTQGKVSKAIVNSLENSPKDFLMLNNGITAIVDNIFVNTINDNAVIKLTNIKIINGQQTSNTIFNQYEDVDIVPKCLEEAFILLKAYKVDPSSSSKHELFNNISNASNQQNAIKSKDLMSTREFNRILSQELVDLGIFYQYRDGQSDYSKQFKGMPKTTLSDLVKMHYIFVTGEVWSRANVGSVFDALTGLVSNREDSKKALYVKEFNNEENEKLANDLKDIAIFQLYFKNKDYLLGKEKQALDLLIYLQLVLRKYDFNYREFDIEEFARFCALQAQAQDRNNYYKSKKEMIILLDKLFNHYRVSHCEEAVKNKKLVGTNEQ